MNKQNWTWIQGKLEVTQEKEPFFKTNKVQRLNVEKKKAKICWNYEKIQNIKERKEGRCDENKNKKYLKKL